MQTEIREKLMSMYSVNNLDTISVFGFRTQVRLCLRRASLQVPCSAWHGASDRCCC